VVQPVAQTTAENNNVHVELTFNPCFTTHQEPNYLINVMVEERNGDNYFMSDLVKAYILNPIKYGETEKIAKQSTLVYMTCQYVSC